MFKRFLNPFFRPYLMSIVGDEGAGGGGGGGGEGKGDEGGEGKGDEGGEGKGGKKVPAETVTREAHDKALADMHKYKKEAKELREREEKAKTDKLKADNQWKELAEANEKKAKEADERSEKLQNSYLSDRKFNAARAACEKLGLRPEAVEDLDALDLGEITVESTSTGKINLLGAEKFAERLKTTKPHWFSDKEGPNVNTGSTRVRDSNGPVTAQQILKAEAEGRKSGDMSGYKALIGKFNQQRVQARRG